MISKRNRLNRTFRLDVDRTLESLEKYLTYDFGVDENLIQLENSSQRLKLLASSEDPSIVKDIEELVKNYKHTAIPNNISKRLQPLTFGGYVPLGADSNITSLLDSLWLRGHKLCLPIYEKRPRSFYYRMTHPRARLVTGPIKIPMPGRESPEVSPDVLFVPVIAFDKNGFFLSALGDGRADRTISDLRLKTRNFEMELKTHGGAPYEAALLARPRQNAEGIYETSFRSLELKTERMSLDGRAKPFVAIGVCHSGLYMDEVPATYHDVMLDAVITEKEFIEISPPEDLWVRLRQAEQHEEF